MIKEMEDRLKEIIKIADKLDWIIPKQTPNILSSVKTDYPLMQLSEVEKCMTAMVDIDYLKLMRKWYEQEMIKEKMKEIEKAKKKS